VNALIVLLFARQIREALTAHSLQEFAERDHGVEE
jgi:hypothetical protein